MSGAAADTPRVVGSRVRSYGWRERTSGQDRYTEDVDPGVPVLSAKIVRSPHPHATIESIDVRRALQLPGVRAVVTAADLADTTRYLHLGGEYSDRRPLAQDRVRFVGEEVAAVAADSADIAARAVALVGVRYRALPAPLTLDAALSEHAPVLHDRSGDEPNVAVHLKGAWGDVESARRTAVVRSEGTFWYPRVTHACMEPNTTLARWHPDTRRLELWTSTQAPHFVVLEVARALGLRQDQVVCREVAVGGGFGAKSKICEHEVITAALAIKAGQPVRITLSREEEFATTKPRHAFRVHLATSAGDDGRLGAIEARLEVDNGAYNHYGPRVMKAGIKALGSIYEPRAVTWDARLVDTALTPGGQFRGYGCPQTAFALESQIDELAEQLHLAPLEFRLLNANRPGSRALSGARPGSARLTECLEAVRDALDWPARRAGLGPGRGVGVAVGVHGSGTFSLPDANRSQAVVDLFGDGRVRIRFGGADAGTGQRTLLAQICAEELGIGVEDVTVETMDSERTPFDMGAWSSRGTHMGGHAARRAARDLAAHLLALGREKLATSDVRLIGGTVSSDSDAITIGDLALTSPDAVDGVLTVEGEYVDARMERAGPGNPTPNASASYTFAAHAVEVEVDQATGQIRVVDYVAAHDVGRAIHPTQVEGQIIGGVAMGLGAALGEELVYEQGRLVNPSYLDYPLPRAGDLPDIRPILVEGGDPAGPYGAKSVGEMSIVPPAPAVANAVYHATSLRFRALPMTPDKVLPALMRQGRAGHRRHRLWRRPQRWWVAGMRSLYPRGAHAALHRWGTRAARTSEPLPIAAVSRPAALRGALAELDAGATALAGGTDLLLQHRQELVSPTRLVSLTGLPELSRSDRGGGGWEIGAAVTLDQLETSRVRRDVPAIAEAVVTIASPQIRRVATVGGNLLQAKRCWFFRNGFDCYKRGGVTCPCYAVLGDHRFHHAAMDAHRCQAVTPSDLATVLVAFDGEAVIAGRDSERRLSVEGLYAGPGEVRLEPGELLRAVVLPGRALERRAVFEKLRLWQGDFAVAAAAVAARIDDRGRWRDVRVVLGAVAPVPWRATATERRLEGQVVTPQLARRQLDRELDARGHPLPGNAWKLDAVAGLVQRAVARVGGSGDQ